MKVFLGGTCAGKDWRSIVIPCLQCDYFNPLVDDWTEECKAREIEERQNCDMILYHINSSMEGVYSIAEIIDDSNKRPDKTIVHIDKDGFSDKQKRSLESVENMARENGAHVFKSIGSCISYINFII